MSDYNTTEQIFRPVKCTEEKLNFLQTKDKIENGYLYFTTDTKKLFLGNEHKAVQMCESKGFYYGKKGIDYPTDGTSPVSEVDFIFSEDEEVSEIEGNSIPELDDLILNIGTLNNADGCFYRITNIVEDNGFTILKTIRLTLQGSGGGASGPVGPIGSNFLLQILGSDTKVFSSQAESIPISFKCTKIGEQQNRIDRIACYIEIRKNEWELLFEDDNSSGKYEFDKELIIDLKDRRNKLSTNKRKIRLDVIDINSLTRSDTCYISLLTLNLIQNKNMGNILFSKKQVENGINNLTYTFELQGAASREEMKSKIIYYKFYDENNLNGQPILTRFREIEVGDQGTMSHTINVSDLPHGNYVLKVHVEAELYTSTKPIPSNELIHKYACYQDIESDNPLFIVNFPKNAMMHMDIPVEYLIVSNEENITYHVKIDIDGSERTTLELVTNKVQQYNLYFEESMDTTYIVLLTLLELNLSYQYPLFVQRYSGTVPIINPTDDTLMFHLSPRGRSNNESNKDIWKDYKNRVNTSNYPLQARLQNFVYGDINGWKKDDNTGIDFLYLTNSGKLISENFDPFGTDYFNANSSNALGMTVELDFELEEILNYDSTIISCIARNPISNNAIQTGFEVIGDKIYFYNSRANTVNNPLLSLGLIEKKRLRISYVIEPKGENSPMCYIYLNGIMSAVTKYDKTEDNFHFAGQMANLLIDSQYANIKLYGVRFYKTALPHFKILNNYIASLPIVQKELRFKTNNVFKSNGKDIDFYKISDFENYDLDIPYMKITGGFPTLLNDKWRLNKDNTTTSAGLPTGKKDYRLIDVEVQYPNNGIYTKHYNFYKTGNTQGLYTFKNEFEEGKTMEESFGSKPINGGCIMYAQGTSSMEYPTKNLRIRFKNDDDFYHVNPDLPPVEIICMKADYMESSGSHNTGSGNFVDSVYDEIGISTPAQRKYKDENIVTCIKGYPCLIFYSDNENNDYHYIGKYNLNLDKATPEPFGFKHDEDDDSFGYLPEGTEYYKVWYGEEDEDTKEIIPGSEFIGQAFPSESGEYISDDSSPSIVGEEDKINAIHCFEFLDNAVEVCNFINKGNNDYYNTWYGTFKNKENKDVPGWTLGFESRYPEDRVGYHDADSLYPFASWVNELYAMYLDEALDKENTGYKPLEENAKYNSATRYYIYNNSLGVYEAIFNVTEENFESQKDLLFVYQRKWLNKEQIVEKEYEYFYRPVTVPSTSDNAQLYYEFNDKTQKWQEVYRIINSEDAQSGKYHTRSIISEKFKLQSLERFKREYHRFLNKNFLLTYYALTEALLMADNRVKNMMIATWGIETVADYYKYDKNKKYEEYKYTLASKHNPNEIYYTKTSEDNYVINYPQPISANFDQQEYYIRELNKDGTDQWIKGEKNYIWYPIFYDMDTMMGLDNTGVYRFNYYDEDYDDTIFNGDEALWQLTRDALWDEIVQLYGNIETSSLSLDKDKEGKNLGILKYYNDNQADIPNEAFFNSDADYKYILPAKQTTDTSGKLGKGAYLYAAQGNRSLQREWFLSNRLKFLRGKYNTRTYQDEDRIVFRWNFPQGEAPGGIEPNDTFDFTSVRNGFAGVLLGANGNVYNTRFTEDNQKQSITLPEAAGANGTEAYILGVSNLKDIGDLSNKYVQKFIIESDEPRLQRIILGNKAKGYDNRFLNNEINLANCKNLEEFNLQNVETYKKTINFADCKNLKKVLMTHSGVSGVTLPINAPINELRLPIMTALTLNGLEQLEDSQFSFGTYEYYDGETAIGEYSGVEIEGKGYQNNFSTLTQLTVINTPINSYKIACEAKGLTTYCLQKINWEIDAEDTQYRHIKQNEWNEGVQYWTYNVETKEFEEYEGKAWINGLYEQFNMLSKLPGTERFELTSIPILERLTGIEFNKNYAQQSSEAVTGTIVINLPKKNGNKVIVDELKIYNRYNKIYPNLNIEYGGNMERIEASKIEFFNIDESTVTDVSKLVPYCSILFNGVGNTYSLAELINKSTTFKNPSKSSTPETEFIFEGQWRDLLQFNSNITYFQDIRLEGINKPSHIDDDKTFTNFKPTSNMKLFPKFTSKEREYKISFYNENYPDSASFMFDIKGHFNDKVHDVISKTQHAPYEFYNYIEKDDLGEYEKYNFEGWIKETDWQEKKTTLLSDISITGDLKLIAKYEVRGVYDPDYTTNINCFKVENGTISVRDEDGVSYRSILKGKITLPLQYHGLDIHTIGDFKETEISHIYFAEGNSKYTTVASGAFNGNTNIINIDLPSSITTINSGAFQDCSSLIGIGNVQSIEKIQSAAFERCYNLYLDLDEMPHLSEIGGSAFAMSPTTSAENISGETLSLVTDLPAFAFQYCPNIDVSNLTKISKTANASASMPSLRGCGQNTTLIQIDAINIQGCSKGAFTGYASKANELEVYNATGLNEETLWQILEDVGLNRDWTDKHIYNFSFGEG